MVASADLRVLMNRSKNAVLARESGNDPLCDNLNVPIIPVDSNGVDGGTHPGTP